MWILKKNASGRRHAPIPFMDAADIINICRTSAYLLVKEGHFNIVRIGNAIRISKKLFDKWLDSLIL